MTDECSQTHAGTTTSYVYGIVSMYAPWLWAGDAKDCIMRQVYGGTLDPMTCSFCLSVYVCICDVCDCLC